VLGRVAALGGLIAAVTAMAAAVPATGGPPLVGPMYYAVQPDPRLCPSPLCGGYWAALANRSRTVCHDGARRPRCYVASAVDEERHPLEVGLTAGALARAEIEPWSFKGFGELGVLVVADVWAPTGRAPPSGGFYRLRDTGMRCIRAPCFSLRASRLNGSLRVTVSDLDLEATRATAEQLERAEAALRTKNGLFAQGRIGPTADGGRLFRATRVFLRVATPRA